MFQLNVIKRILFIGAIKKKRLLNLFKLKPKSHLKIFTNICLFVFIISLKRFSVKDCLSIYEI